MEIPTTRRLSDAERYVEGLKLLAKECNLNTLLYNMLGITKFIFSDGSSIGGMRAFIDAGYVTFNEDIQREDGM